MKKVEVNRIEFADLSTPLKVLVVLGWIGIVLFGLAIIYAMFVPY